MSDIFSVSPSRDGSVAQDDAGGKSPLVSKRLIGVSSEQAASANTAAQSKSTDFRRNTTHSPTREHDHAASELRKSCLTVQGHDQLVDVPVALVEVAGEIAALEIGEPEAQHLGIAYLVFSASPLQPPGYGIGLPGHQKDF